MRKHIYNWLFVATLGIICTATVSCEKVDELPPINDTSTSSKHYKVDDPTLPTDEQQALYEEIKAEYEDATSGSN